ncbi:MAG: nicotinate phosphoribosyltransferase [Kiloniellales bacterium]|nr:nicotinate phosphoribosyltransferase [Kiloniellales bacterium]
MMEERETEPRAPRRHGTDGLPAALGSSLLLTDLYELNMMQAYLEAGMTETAVFEFFVRKLPAQRGFLMAAGLEQVVAFLTGARFTAEELAWLQESGRFSRDFVDYLEALRFDGDVDAMREGTLFFTDEPILRLAAALPVAQLMETRIINLLHFQCVIASKAARMVLAAGGKRLIDFGLRRAHGAEAGLLAARAAYIAGFDGTATTSAGRAFGIPIVGTMAHSFIQAHGDEAAAFENFARSRPDRLVLLLDTYDTLAAARKVIDLVPKLRQSGIEVRGVRLDSGDLVAEARAVRTLLDRAGLPEIEIFASGGLDEAALAVHAREAAPIDGYGIGTSLTTSSDAPALDCAYKLQEYAGRPTRKVSSGKATWPGRKQVYRHYSPSGADDPNGGTNMGDTVTREDEASEGVPLVRPVMRDGRLVGPLPDLAELRAHASAELRRLPTQLQRLESDARYPVEISSGLRELAKTADRLRSAAG